MDANQGMDLPSAIKLSNGAKDLNIHWFEEPVNHQDFQAYQILKNQTGISLAMGEREFDTLALRELVIRNALDIWQPDILRIGITALLQRLRCAVALYHSQWYRSRIF